jgi:hypothetical protein
MRLHEANMVHMITYAVKREEKQRNTAPEIRNGEWISDKARCKTCQPHVIKKSVFVSASNLKINSTLRGREFVI